MVKIQKIEMEKFLLKVFISMFFLVMLSFYSFSQKKIARSEDANVKISLNAYSFTKPLLNYAKDRGKGPRMTLFDFMDFAAAQGFDAVDLTAYFFPGYPEVPSNEFINQVKKYAFQLGLDISGTGIRNDFANPNPAKRAADVKHVKEWIEVAAKLGAPVIRVFSGPIPVGYENKRDEIEKYMTESLKECAEHGELSIERERIWREKHSENRFGKNYGNPQKN